MTTRILTGDVRAVLATLPAESVHCVVTSPPYFGLRAYQTEPQVWGDASCAHRWEDATVIDSRHLPEVEPTLKQASNTGSHQRGVRRADVCLDCGAWRGELGLEPSLDLYLDHVVEICRAIRRVLRKDGTFWLNVGDSYAGSWGAQGRRTTESDEPSWHSSQIKNHPKRVSHTGSMRTAGLKPKDLMLVPHRLALALQADGCWWVRDEIVYSKLNPMPESVTDRCTRAHEFVFMLTKSARYFYDAEAIKEGRQGNTHSRGTKRSPPIEGAGIGHEDWCAYMDRDDELTTRNKRSVWTLASEPFPDAHFATFPTHLVEPCILAGTSARGVCPECGAPWVRVVEKSRRFESGSARAGNMPSGKNGNCLQGGGATLDIRRGPCVDSKTTGWRATCHCVDLHRRPPPPVPAVILDCFGGSGTTGLVADRLGRDCILIDLNPDYAAMAHNRIVGDAGLFAEVAAE